MFIIILTWLNFVLLFLVSDLEHLFSGTNTFSCFSYCLVLYFEHHILLLGYRYFMNWQASFLFKKEFIPLHVLSVVNKQSQVVVYLLTLFL